MAEWMSEPITLIDRIDRLGRLAAAEMRHDLFAYGVDGWSAWRVTRNFVQRTTARYGLASPRPNDGKRVIRALAATVRLMAILAFPPQVDLLVKTARSGLRMAVGEQYRDVYFDGLLATTRDHFKLEEINTPDFDRQARAAMFPGDLDPVVFTFWGRVLGKLFPAPAADFAAKVSTILRDEIGVIIGADALLMRVSTAWWQSRIYLPLLQRLRPQVVMVSDTGEYGLLIACARLGVPIVELQHGVFDVTHPDAIPATVPGKREHLLLPDVLASRGGFWIGRLAGAHQAGRAVVVGNELIDVARAKRSARAPSADRHFVLTSQGLDSERLAAWIAQMIASAPAGLDWRLSVKFHPVYDADNRHFDDIAREPRVTLISGGSAPNAFDLLADADLHLSIASACHFDALALGVPTVVVPLSGHENVIDAVDGRRMFLAASPAEVWSLNTREWPAEASREFSEPEFLNNMNRLLDDLKKKGPYA